MTDFRPSGEVPLYSPNLRELPGKSVQLVQRTPIPGECGVLPKGTTARCTMAAPTWNHEAVALTDAGNLILLAVTGSVESVITLSGARGKRLAAFPGAPLAFAKVIALWAPRRMTCTAEVMVTSGDCTIERGEVSCPVGLCIVVDCDAPYYQAWWVSPKGAGS